MTLAETTLPDGNVLQMDRTTEDGEETYSWDCTCGQGEGGFASRPDVAADARTHANTEHGTQWTE